jgi:Glutaminase
VVATTRRSHPRALSLPPDSDGLERETLSVALREFRYSPADRARSRICLEAAAVPIHGAAPRGPIHGVHPLTGERVIGEETCRHALAVMTTAGLYETSGDWLYDVGLPGKSGIGGGIVTVAPGKDGVATFAPPLDAAGNSVRGTARNALPVARARARHLQVARD